jgi:protein-disulfide isomerase
MSETKMAGTETSKTDTSDLTIPVGADDHSQGAGDAPVTLVEYGDYECSYCGAAHPIVKKLQNKMGDKLRFVFRNFPLTQVHPFAEHAAEAAEVADAQGKFWEMHDALFENQDALEDENLTDYAKRVGLDGKKFIEDLQNDAFKNRIRADFTGGVESGVNGTPTFFINGVRYDQEVSYETLLAALESA